MHSGEKGRDYSTERERESTYYFPERFSSEKPHPCAGCLNGESPLLPLSLAHTYNWAQHSSQVRKLHALCPSNEEKLLQRLHHFKSFSTSGIQETRLLLR